MNLHCIVCGTWLKNYGGPGQNQPSAGTAFFTHGHYGSTAFDPMDGTFLEINICDPCLVRRAGEGFVVEGQDLRHVLDEQGCITSMKKIPPDEQPPLRQWNRNTKEQK